MAHGNPLSSRRNAAQARHCKLEKAPLFWTSLDPWRGELAPLFMLAHPPATHGPSREGELAESRPSSPLPQPENAEVLIAVAATPISLGHLIGATVIVYFAPLPVPSHPIRSLASRQHELNGFPL